MNRIAFVWVAAMVLLLSACNNTGKNNTNEGFNPGNFNPETMIDRQMERLDESLELSKKQQKQVRETLSSGMNKMMQLREKMQDAGGFEGMREQMIQVREEQNKKFKEILSEEQWVKYQELEKERRARRGQGRPQQ